MSRLRPFSTSGVIRVLGGVSPRAARLNNHERDRDEEGEGTERHRADGKQTRLVCREADELYLGESREEAGE